MARGTGSGLEPATIENCDTGDTIKCMFNPTEYTVAKSNSWEPGKAVGKNVQKLTFTGGAGRTMNFELLLDRFEEKDKDLKDDIAKLWALAEIDEKSKNTTTNRGRPPLCRFKWGKGWEFKAAVTSLSIRYTLFRESGAPVRAMASISLQEAEDVLEQQGTNPTSRSELGYKRREVKQNDTLALMAFEEYGDSALWRMIADENSIDDPMSIQPGQILAIPPRK